ncbi:MAG TPA: hypothetical protein VG820_12655, partial [Fimbriimonadaceae bacterium]|nr:hypothetical protein [Fimbriimonadaceae bacterium]
MRPILRALRQGRFFRSAVVRVAADRKATAVGWIASRYLTLALLAAVLLAALVGIRIAVSGWQASDAWLHAAASVLALLVGGWAIARLADLAAARRTLALYSRWVLSGETLIVVSTVRDRAAAAAAAMSEAAGEHLALFVLNPPEPLFADAAERSGSALTEDEALVRAAKIGAELAGVKRDHPPKRSLLPRLSYCEAVLLRIQKRLEGAVRLEQSVALSAEWLLDNAYVVQGHVDDFRRNLPAGYYRELPYLTSGIWKGLPRVYAVACEVVESSDGRLTRKAVESFLQAFQTESVLTIAELWALPMMIRLRLIEFLTALGVDVERRQIESEKVAFWANRLLYTARRQPDRMPEVIAAVAAENPTPTPHLVEELLEHLYDEDRALTPVRAWLETRFSSPLEDVIRRHEQIETLHQASLANSISSLRLLAQFDWRDLFESVSRVDAVLWGDPAGIYGEMDFESRDSYRHQIEQLSRRKGMPEHVLAEEAASLSRRHSEPAMRHVGFFLVDDGLPELERQIGAPPPFRCRVQRWVKKHPATVYLSGIALATTGLLAGALALSSTRNSWADLLLAALYLLPAADLAVQLVNYVITRGLRPRALPKMAFDEGIPDEFRTLVIVPMMLLTPESIRNEIERLEIRALANPDANLRYGLLADYSDAPQEHMPEDVELLDVARRGIETLNQSHGAGRFLLFYRDRGWCDDEQCWMGWERKRGKIEELNRLLLHDEEDGVQFGIGGPGDVDGVRFVITLDSDTQLPRDTATRLVATLAHPLNAPELSDDGRRVLRGYGIIQPRVSTSLPSATASIFTRLFTDPTGMDPYTHAVSDVYQDLAGWASYHGKGIYDLRAFHGVVGRRFPEAHLLSHDLIEGAYTRVALASDIELLDLFPENYGAYCARQHRWIRGDWQIADWIGLTVPLPNGRSERNPLPPLERWKILDNLRRSLTPVAVLAMLIFGCALSQRPMVCAGLVVALLLASFAFPLATR